MDRPIPKAQNLSGRPRLAVTLGDVAGIGPEIVARSWPDPRWHAVARPIVFGDPSVLRRTLATLGSDIEVRTIAHPDEGEPTPRCLPCLSASSVDLSDVKMGRVDARAGRAAYDFLMVAIDAALGGRVDGIVTLPLNKEALHAAGVPHPGHTEILAEACGVDDFAMMLYLDGPATPGGRGLGVLHATLHVALREVFELLSLDRVERTIALADQAMRCLTGGQPPRVGVAGLNPHAGEGGLFGREEIEVIGPAVEHARRAGLDVVGPIAADTLFARALNGEFDAVVAMYHDQGHVALKTIGFDRAVNVTVGLPIIRTSVAHGTAFDIAGTGRAGTSSLFEAGAVAARLATAAREARASGDAGLNAPRPWQKREG